MVTNINLSSPEDEKKPALTGKATLVVSGVLLVVAISTYGFFAIAQDKNTKEAEQIKSEIEQKKKDLSDSDYAEVADFQERLNLLDKTLSSRFSWSGFILELSKFVLPEVRLDSFSPEEGKDDLPIKGKASSYENVVREINLLKKVSGVESVELKDVYDARSTEGQQAGVAFSAVIKLNKKAFMENNSSN